MLQDNVALRLTVYLGDSIGYYPCCSTCISLLLSPSPCWICVCFVQFRTMHRPVFVPVCERVQVHVCARWQVVLPTSVTREWQRLLATASNSARISPWKKCETTCPSVQVDWKGSACRVILNFFHAADELCRRGLQRRETGRSTTRRGTWC